MLFDLSKARVVSLLELISLGSVLGLNYFFVTSPYYANIRMFTSKPRILAPLNIAGGSFMWAKISCGALCASNGSCFAFNIYETNSSYVCELLQDNVCQSSSSATLANWPGSSVWDKLSPGRTRSCWERKYSSMSAIPCSSLMPNCLGDWPNCSSCVRNCIDCKKRLLYSGNHECTFWPEGAIPYAKPISGLCFSEGTYLIKREVNLVTHLVVTAYQLPFEDVARVIKQGAYSILEFFFLGATIQTFKYQNPYIDAEGTLSNLTFLSGPFDLLGLNGQVLKPTPFVTVTDDLYGCGSFWLFNNTNGTYCPGGRVSMLGTVKTFGLGLQTGIRVNSESKYYGSLTLYP